jgi:hypothetical protein
MNPGNYKKPGFLFLTMEFIKKNLCEVNCREGSMQKYSTLKVKSSEPTNKAIFYFTFIKTNPLQ